MRTRGDRLELDRLIGERVGRLCVGQHEHSGTGAHGTAFEERERIGDHRIAKDVLLRDPHRVLRERGRHRVAVVLHRDLGQRLARDMVLVDVAPRHQRVVRGVHPAQLRLEIPVGCRGDIGVTDFGRHLVHPLPSHDRDQVGVAGRDGQRARQDGVATGGTARLDFDVAQRIEAQVVVDLGARQELVAEVVGERRVDAEVDQALKLLHRHFEVVVAHGHIERVGTQLRRVLFRVPLAEIGHAARDDVHRSFETGDAEIAGLQVDHRRAAQMLHPDCWA